MKTMKGQITLISLLVFLVVFFLYLVLVPTLVNNFINPTVAALQAGAVPGDFTSVLIVLIQLIPLWLLIAIFLSVISYAIPLREGQ